MKNASVLYLLVLSLVGGVAGSLSGSIFSYWLNPSLQYDFFRFLEDLFSVGGALSALFVCIFYVPSYVIALLLCGKLIGLNPKSAPIILFLTLPFIFVVLSSISSYIVPSRILFYLLNLFFVEILAVLIMYIIQRNRATMQQSA